MSKKPKQPLLTKYNIPIDHLDFDYIKKCNNFKEIEKILQILRSGEEGFYADLTKCAEDKLRSQNPSSKLLRTERPVLTKHSIDENEWNKVTDLVENFTLNTKNEHHSNHTETSVNKMNYSEIPPIRCTKQSVIEMTKSLKKETSNDRIKSYDYEKWEKYDPDTEILKMDLQEEKCRKQAERENNKMNNKPKIEIIEPSTISYLSEERREQLANNHRLKGNEFFKTRDFDEAILEYTSSLNFFKTSTAFNNRAMAYIKVNKYAQAIDDCEECLKIEPDNVKALMRSGLAFKNIGEMRTAYDKYVKVLQIEPDNAIARREIETLQKQMPELPPSTATRLKIQDANKSDGNNENPETEDCFAELIKPSKIVRNKLPKTLSDFKEVGKTVERNLKKLQKIERKAEGIKIF